MKPFAEEERKRNQEAKGVRSKEDGRTRDRQQSGPDWGQGGEHTRGKESIIERSSTGLQRRVRGEDL